MKVAIIDADLIGRKRHRFPNLVCMKLSGFHKSQGDEVELKLDYEDLDSYEKVYISKVFSDTFVPEEALTHNNVEYGGTGFFYDKAPRLPEEIEHHMPDYTLYDEWVQGQLAAGKKRVEYRFYLDYSIGFLTRGCFRKCKFCVNQNYTKVCKHSPLEEFYDPSRKKICLLDDNFLGHPEWKEMLRTLQQTGKPFQFKQGMDERILTDEKCRMLFSSKYDGDFIFAFDNVEDADLIEKKIQLLRKYTDVIPKFYCFTGFDREDRWDSNFWKQDIFDLFRRIEILMKYQCIPYVMRFNRYTESPYRGMYITIARWCNQPSLFKKKSLREFGALNDPNSACRKYLSDFEEQFPEVAYFYDMKFAGGNEVAKTTTQMELVSIDKLIPYVNNARTHSAEQVNKLRSSLREFGFINPVIIDKDYGVIAGHGRLLAAREEGITEVPCVLVDYLTEAQKKAYILADNRYAQDAGWDEELLKIEIEALQAEAFDVSLTGFEDQEIADLFAEDTEGEEDGFDVDEELQKPCFSKEGDIWQLGRHKVICGDSTLPETYEKLLGTVQPNLVCTDPPYLVALENASGKIKNDDLNDADGYEFLKKAFTCFHDFMARDASIYVFYATMKARVFYDAYEDAGFKVGAGLIWKKPRAPLMRTDWKFNMEPIIFGWRKDGKHIWYGDQKQKAVFEFDGIKNSKEDGCGHPSSKPVPLLVYLIKQCTQANGIVLDGFLGSASTLMACDQMGRICYGIELEPKFVDVAVNRYLASHDNNDHDIVLIRDGKQYSYQEALDMMEG